MTITITIPADKENDLRLIKKEQQKEYLKISKNLNILSPIFILQKRSLDARHGKQKLHLRYEVFNSNSKNIGDNTNVNDNFNNGTKGDTFTNTPLNKNTITDGKLCTSKVTNQKILIIGCGPAGLFAALTLLDNGLKPLIIDMGCDVHKRKMDIIALLKTGVLNPNSNYCFGAGGAGTFSDGKLYTRSSKRGDINEILKVLVKFGADKNILTDSHAHIGSNKLPIIIDNIIKYLRENGCGILFNTKLCGLKSALHKSNYLFDNFDVGESLFNEYDKIKKIDELDDFSERVTQLNGCANDKKMFTAITANTITNKVDIITCDKIILAAGHANIDIYKIIANINPAALQSKDFAIGVRVEHPRSVIDSIQYHSKKEYPMGAQYRLTTQVNGRGVYSFCMCPGGVVVPSFNEAGTIVVNGMSASARSGFFSNSAIVVETKISDIPMEFFDAAKNDGCEALGALYYRQFLEKEAYKNGLGTAPAQKLLDFLSHKKSTNLPRTSYTPRVTSSNLYEWLPQFISQRLEEAFLIFNQKMQGFICDDALLIAIETRTSTPIRIIRDKTTFETKIKGLFAAGEVSGYSGGITTSALDGVNIARAIISC